MRDNLIHVSPFQLLDILSVKGHQQINEHGYISFPATLIRIKSRIALLSFSRRTPSFKTGETESSC